jgi:hypothetical protein
VNIEKLVEKAQQYIDERVATWEKDRVFNVDDVKHEMERVVTMISEELDLEKGES